MNQGIDFNLQNITAQDMAHFKYIFSGKQAGGVTKGCTMSYTTTTISISAGYFICYGRQVKITGTESISIPTVTEGTDYCRLVYEIDLSKTNTESTFLQGYFKLLESTTAYPTLTQQNLDDHPTDGVFQLPFAKFTVDINGMANWVDERASFDVLLTGTLTAGATSLTISSPSIETTSLYDIYTSNWACQPETVTVTNGSMTMTFEAQASDVTIKVKVH